MSKDPGEDVMVSEGPKRNGNEGCLELLLLLWLPIFITILEVTHGG